MSRASATALLVALSVWRHGCRFGLPAEAMVLADSALREAGGGWSLLRRWAAGRFGSRLLEALEARLLPGLAAHHCRRKQWLWRWLAGRTQARQRIWLGVGFDGLGRALAQRPGQTDLLETDHDDSLAARRRALAATPLPPVRSQPLRLPDDAAELLRLCDSAPTTLIAEGLLMYLPPRPLLRVLHALARLPQPPELCFSALAPTRPGGVGFSAEARLTRRWLARHREPFRWRLALPRMQALLRRHGYHCVECWDGEGYGEYLLRAQPLPGPVGRAAAG